MNWKKKNGKRIVVRRKVRIDMGMKQSFYQYLMTERDPKKRDAVTAFANHAQFDGSFPKQSTNYNEISRYLELSNTYLPSMTVFDEAWERYVESSQSH